METFAELVEILKNLIIELAEVLPIVFSAPIAILILALIFKNPLIELLFSFSHLITSNAEDIKNRREAYNKQIQMQENNTFCSHSNQQKAAPPESNSNIHQNVAKALALKGSYDEAIKQYHIAINLDPDNISAYIGLGNSYHKIGKYTEAIRTLEKAVDIKPYWADCRCNLAAAYSLSGLHEKAIDEFIQAININPNYAAAHYGLGIAFVSAGQLEKAQEQAERLKSLEPSFSEKLFKTLEDTKNRQEKSPE